MMPTVRMPDIYSKGELIRILKACFNLPELIELCADLGIKWENLGGTTRQEKAIELAEYCERRSLLVQLDGHIRGLRPEVCPEAGVRPHSPVSLQQNEPASTEKWRLMAVLSSLNLVRIAKAIARMQIEQSRLCQLVEAEIQDLPEQKRTQVKGIIESNCEHCRRERTIIQVLAEDGADDWRGFIKDNCTAEEYESYMDRMRLASQRLDRELPASPGGQCEPPGPVTVA